MQSSNPVITVVRDPSNRLGKFFDIQPDGTVSKRSVVNLSFGIAVQHRVPSHEDLARLLNEVGDDPSAAVINAGFPDIPVEEEFVILSEREIEDRLGIPSSDRARQQGVHKIDYAGKTMPAVGRFKENVRPSSWQLLDRDVDAHTPAQFAKLSIEEWLAELCAIVPGVDRTSYVVTPSASSRVMRDGKPAGRGNGHVWVFVENPDDVERARSTILLRAMQADLSWNKPRYSKQKLGVVAGQSPTTIIDPSVLTSGRLVFDGKPSVGEGLTVLPMRAEVHHRSNTVLDTSAMVMPDRKTMTLLSRKTGVTFQVDSDGGGVRATANDLTLDTEIEAADGISTVRELIENGLSDKVRCQSPFRDSVSCAAFISVDGEGNPFVYDSGDCVTHWLNEDEQNELRVIRASAKVDNAIPRVREDGAAALEDEVVSSMAALRRTSPSEYQRKRAALKQANGQVSLASLDRAVKVRDAETDTAQTHNGYAKSLLAELTEGAYRPVGFHGTLYVLDPVSGLWVSLPVETLVKNVAEMHDGKDHCSRSGDYWDVAELAIALADDRSFFATAAVGIACLGGFYQIVDDEIILVPLTPEHRQRVMLPYTPTQQATPLFAAFLHDTFASEREGEEAEQIALMQEIAGAILLGLMARFQKAILFYEPFGRAGKGTQERILRGLVPVSFVQAVSPFKWSQDYHVAALAGARLNVVGELPENEALPAAAFKSLIGGDLVTGRHPTHRPITFANEAAHVFMSNHLITTKDQSEAFYARWITVVFPNSRLRSGLPIDPGLAERIITREMPGIAYWALEGAKRLLANGDFSKSAAHERLMAKWRRSTSSVNEFIHECCELSADCQVRRAEFYSSYTQWCAETGRKAYSKSRVKELLEHNIGLGVRWAEVNGIEVFRGLKLKSTATDKHIPNPVF